MKSLDKRIGFLYEPATETKENPPVKEIHARNFFWNTASDILSVEEKAIAELKRHLPSDWRGRNRACLPLGKGGG